MLAKIAFGDIGKLFDEHGQPKRLFELSDDIGPAVKTLKAGEARDSTGAVRRRWFSISVHDKFRALAFLLESASAPPARRWRMLGLLSWKACCLFNNSRRMRPLTVQETPTSIAPSADSRTQRSRP